MDSLSLQMPLWAILYSGLIFASASGTIMISGRRDLLYITGEYLSAAFSIMFFAIYYTVVPYPSMIVLIMMLGFILFQEIWINRKLYGFLDDGSVPKDEQKFLLIFTLVFFSVLLAPFIWVVYQVMKQY